MAYDPSVGIAPRGPTPMSTPSNVGGGSGAGGGLASLSSFSAVAAAPLGSSSAASAAPPPPTSDKIIKEVMHKITQIVVRARLPSHLDSSSRNNGWFNLNLPEWAGVRGQLEHLLVDGNPSSSGGGPSSFGCSSSLGGSGLLGSSANPIGSSSSSSSSSNAPVTSALIVLDLLMHSTLDPRHHVLLERWNIQHERHQALANVTAARKADPGSTYKKLLLLVRSVYCFVKLLPAYAAWRLVQSASESTTKPSPPPFKMNHQLSSDHRSMERLQSEGWMNSSGVAPMIPQPIFDCSPRLFTFHSVATPLGKFTLSVLYRPDLNSIDFLQAAGMQIGQRISSSIAGSSAAQVSHQRGSSASSAQSPQDGVLHPQLTAAGSEQIVMMENWMVAPETNNPNPRDQHAASHQGQADPAATQHQQQPVIPAQHPPKSALALSLEAVKKQRENSGSTAAQQPAPSNSQPLDPRLHDRRHTLPPNSLYPQQPQAGQYPSQHQQHPSDGSGPRIERSASVFQQPQHHSSQQHPHSLPRDALFIPGGRGSSDQGSHESLSSSKPMSIPRQQLGFVPSQSQPSQQTHPQQQHHSGPAPSHHHSPNSHSPSYSNSFTPPVPFIGAGAQQQHHATHSHHPSMGSTPHSYTGATAYSPFTAAGQYLPPSSTSSSPGQPNAPQAGSGGGQLPSPSSLTNLGSLLEETAEEEQNRMALLQSNTPPNALPQALYDNTPSASQNIGGTPQAYPQHSQQQPHSGLAAPSRLPHSISQPLGLSPQMRPQPSPGSISSSGSLPQPIPIPVSPFINPAATPGGASSRKNSGIFGSSPDGGFAVAAPLTLGSSPLSSSYKGASPLSSKPPLPSSGTSYTPFAASSRVTTSTSTFSSPAIGPQLTPPSSGGGGIVIRERDAGSSSSLNRFSGLNAAQALPPPKLGTSSPTPSGLSRALQQQQQVGTSFAESQQAQSHMTALSLLSPGGGGGGAGAGVSSVSPLSDTSHRGDSSSPSSISRPISIPIKPAAAAGGSGGATISGSLQFGRTPPSIGAGSQTTLGLMQQQSAGLGMGPSPPTGLDTILGTSAGHRGSAQWLHSADVLGSSAGSGATAGGIQLNVAPFKASVPGRKASISGHSPVLAGASTPNTPAQRVPIVPQTTLPPFDLKAPAPTGDGVSGPSSISSSPAVHHGFTPVSAVHPASISHSGTFDPSSGLHDFDGHEGDGLESFHTYLQSLQLQQEQRPALQMFAADASSDGASQRLPHSSISASPVPAGVTGSVSGSTSQLHVSVGGGAASLNPATHSSSSTMMGGVRHTTVQSLFDQLDRLQASTAAHQSSATPRN